MTLRTRIPFIHFFDGFRTSHEIDKIRRLPEAVMRGLVDAAAVASFRSRALNPMHPHQRGTSQDPGVYMQMVESAEVYYREVQRGSINQGCWDAVHLPV